MKREPRKPPRLAGVSLRVFVHLLEGRWIGTALRAILFRETGISSFRERALVEPPTPLPVVPPSAAQFTEMPVRMEQLEMLAKPSADFRGFMQHTILDYVQAYRSGRSDPERVARKALEAIVSSNESEPPMSAVIKWNEVDLLRQAQASRERWRNGRPLSLLDGVPVAIKDELDQIPYPTHVGTSFIGGENASEDATVTARLRAAGALLIGKTNMHEIGLGVTGLNPHWGVVRNPHNPAYHTGGSSSGSGAAVAAGLCPLALGADGGGSIRIPAAFCGVVGFKPTFGRVSVHGAYPLSWSMGHLGPLAASACDVAIAYAVIAGRDPADPMTQVQPPVHLNDFQNSDLSGMRLGVCDAWLANACLENIRAFEAALAGFQERGAEILPISLPDPELIRVAHAILIATEMAEAMETHYPGHQKDFGLDVRLTLALARKLTGSDYIKAQCARSRAITEFARAFKTVDAIVSPTTACLTPAIRPDALPDGESDFGVLSDIMRFLAAGNLTGLPAVSFPIAYDSRGLPIGMQATARWWNEALALRLAATAEEFVERRRPAVHFDLLAE